MRSWRRLWLCWFLFASLGVADAEDEDEDVAERMISMIRLEAEAAYDARVAAGGDPRARSGFVEAYAARRLEEETRSALAARGCRVFEQLVARLGECRLILSSARALLETTAKKNVACSARCVCVSAGEGNRLRRIYGGGVA